MDCIANLIVYLCVEVSICGLKGFVCLPTGDWFHAEYSFESFYFSLAKVCLMMLYAEDFECPLSYSGGRSPCIPPSLLYLLCTMNVRSAFEWPHP